MTAIRGGKRLVETYSIGKVMPCDTEPSPSPRGDEVIGLGPAAKHRRRFRFRGGRRSNSERERAGKSLLGSTSTTLRKSMICWPRSGRWSAKEGRIGQVMRGTEGIGSRGRVATNLRFSSPVGRRSGTCGLSIAVRTFPAPAEPAEDITVVRELENCDALCQNFELPEKSIAGRLPAALRGLRAG